MPATDRPTKQDDSYMPHADFPKRMWMLNFIKVIDRHEDRLGIPAEAFESCKQAVEAFAEAYVFTQSPMKRTKSATIDKNEKRGKAVQHCRALAMRLKHDPAITRTQKLSLGLHLDDPVLTRLNRPKCSPNLMVRNTSSGDHEISFRQSFGSRNKAKPKGITHLLLFAAIGDGPLPVSEARLIAGVTKQRHRVEFPAYQGIEGKTITYYGRWMSRKGEMGPWSKGESMILSRANGRQGEQEFSHWFTRPQKVAAEMEAKGKNESRAPLPQA